MNQFTLFCPEAGKSSCNTVLTKKRKKIITSFRCISSEKTYFNFMTCSTPVTDGVITDFKGAPNGVTVPRTTAYGIFLSFCLLTIFLRFSSIVNCGAF